MEIRTHQINKENIAELISEEILINSPEDGLQIMVDLYYQDFGKIIIHEKNLTPAFFDLKTGIAGEVLQKFSNYRMQLIIIGKFSKYESKSIKDFIYESNKTRQINFMENLTEALERFS